MLVFHTFVRKTTVEGPCEDKMTKNTPNYSMVPLWQALQAEFGDEILSTGGECDNRQMLVNDRQ